jgi:hypothetical protein
MPSDPAHTTTPDCKRRFKGGTDCEADAVVMIAILAFASAAISGSTTAASGMPRQKA